MEGEINSDIHPCRIIIIGLPYSGKNRVADILQ